MAADPLDLIDALRRAPHFEAGARAILEILLSEAERLLPGRSIDRGTAYLRPGGSFRGVVVVERRAPRRTPDLIASASVWRLLADRREPLVIDVAARSARVGAAGQVALPQARTLHGLQRRAARSLLALPLIDLSGALGGAVTLEVGDEGPGDLDAARALARLVDAAALALPALPLAPAPARDAGPLLPVVGEVLRRQLGLLEVFAAQEEILLFTGPTGAGKSRLARWCHTRSTRADGPFEVAVLSTAPEEMQLPVLFGWRKGAFTGAVRDSPGAIQRAAHGTLFIDEIDKLSLRAQAGLLQFLETGEYRPLGDLGPLRAAGVRVMVGTNVDLVTAVTEGRFLQDLLFRIDVFPVRVTPLSERVDEIPGWARFMAARRHRAAGLSGEVQVTAAASALLAAQAWPGNLRQLDNVVRRAYALALRDRAGEDVQIGERQVAEALSLGSRRRPEPAAAAPPEGWWPALQAAAASIAAEAAGEQAGPDLSVVEALPGLVLLNAVRQTGDIKSAYLAMGRGALVSSRGYNRDFRRRVERLRALCEALELPLDPELRALMDG